VNVPCTQGTTQANRWHVWITCLKNKSNINGNRKVNNPSQATEAWTGTRLGAGEREWVGRTTRHLQRFGRMRSMTMTVQLSHRWTLGSQFDRGGFGRVFEAIGDDGRIAAAKLIPLGEIGKQLGELDPEADIVIHCKSGMRSARACGILRAAGFKRVRNMKGGILAWSDRVDRSVPKY